MSISGGFGENNGKTKLHLIKNEFLADLRFQFQGGLP